MALAVGGFRLVPAPVALAVVLVVSGLAAGTSSAAPGDPATQTVSASLTYRCQFPAGPRRVQVTVTAGVPATGRAGQPIQPAGLTLTLALPPAAVAGLAGPHSTGPHSTGPHGSGPRWATVRAATRLTVTTTDAVSAATGAAQAAAIWPGASHGPVPVPVHGGLTLHTPGLAPAVTPAGRGNVILAAAKLALTLAPGKTGTPAPSASATPISVRTNHKAPSGDSGRAMSSPPATVSSPAATTGPALRAICAPIGGQQAVLATVPVTGHKAARLRHAPTSGICPKLPPGGLKLNPRFPPPPHPPPTFEAHSPSQGCAFTTGYADVRKLKGAALISPALTNVDLTVTALQNTKPSIDYFELDNVAELDFHGKHEFPPSTATFLSFGFVPTTATIELVEHGTINIFAVGPAGTQSHCRPNKWRSCDNIATAFSRLSVQVVPGSVKVNGVPLDVGTQCATPQFDAVLTGSSATNPPYFVQTGGPLIGDVTIPNFQHCGVGENLNPIFNAAIAGTRNFNLLTQGAPCFVQGGLGCDPHGRPIPPTPLRKVSG